MIRLFKYLLRALTGVAVLASLIGVLLYYITSQSLPDYNARHKVEGAQGLIRILRDNHAVPYISAEIENDVFFGLGYAHAEDRLWQMLMLRRKATGRLSEVFGEATLEIDMLMRSLNLEGVSVASLKFQTPQTRAILDAYAAGVNARLRVINKDALGRGAPELLLFSKSLPPWTAVDTLSVMRLIAYQSTDKGALEILQARIALEAGTERLRDLFPDAQGKAITALPDYARLFDQPPQPADDQTPIRHALWPVPKPGYAGASNAFAAATSRSAAGASLLATDPHSALTAPGQWMLAQLDLHSGAVVGATIPGIPAILIGRNADFGWGITASSLDDQDYYIEKLNPQNPDEYLTPTGHETFQRRSVIIDIKDKPGKTIELLNTRHGPVIDPQHLTHPIVLPPGHVAALAWTALDPDDQSLDAYFGLMRANSVEDARAQLHHAKGFTQNVIMADASSIGMQATGRAPVRQPNHTSQGRIPAPGWLAENDWLGYLPFEENPFVINPSSGIVVNTNNRTTDAPFPNHWAFDWGDDQRILRAERKLNERQFHTLDSFIEIQTDTVSPAARTLIPLIAQDLWYTEAAAAEGTVERRRQAALELLAEWNGDMTEHDPEPLIYAAWARELQKRLIRDELGPLWTSLPELRPLFIERVFRDVDGAAAWCDVVQTPRKETCANMAKSSLDASLQDLVETYGDRIESWRWGGVHEAVHRHETLGSTPILRWFVNIQQDTGGGDHTMLRGKTLQSESDPFLNVHASGFRAVYDFSDPEASVFIASTGQSGHFLSRHYDDMAQEWRRGEYIPMTLDPELARGGAVGVTFLEKPE